MGSSLHQQLVWVHHTHIGYNLVTTKLAGDMTTHWTILHAFSADGDTITDIEYTDFTTYVTTKTYMYALATEEERHLGGEACYSFHHLHQAGYEQL